MKKLIVLGPGCPRCDALAEATRQAADELGLAYQLEKVRDITEFPKYGLMMTPGLVIDGQLKVHGKVPTVEQLKALLA